MNNLGCCAESGPEVGLSLRETGCPLRRPAQAAEGAVLPPQAPGTAKPGGQGPRPAL
jgi:hypothetical protein